MSTRSGRRSRRPSDADKHPTRILITAGPTREYLDPVRYLSNDSSGQMGFALAEAAVRRGHAVTLVHGPVALTLPPGVQPIAVVSAREMWQACRNVWHDHDCLIMAAAVADYVPARVMPHKRKKTGRELSLILKQTPDILARLSRTRRKGQTVIGFALEDRQPRRNAEKKLREKGLDAIVLNAPAAIGTARSRVEVLARGGEWQPLPLMSKRQLALRLMRMVERLNRQ